MSKSLPPAPGVPDRFHGYLDRRMRAARGLGNGSQFVFELAGTVDADDLRARLEGARARVPRLNVALQGSRWVACEEPVPVREEAVDGSVEDWFGRWFGEPFRPLEQPSLEVVLGRTGGGTAVLLRWLHALSDAPGMDLLCRLLDGEERLKLEEPAGALVRRLRGDRSLLRRVWDVHHLMGRHVLRELIPPVQAPVDRRARQTVRSATLSRDQTAALWARAGELSGTDRNAFLLAASARAFVRAFRPAGWRSVRLPVPVNLRPPAWRGPVLGNWFAMVLLQLPVRRLRTLEEAVTTVRAAWRGAIARHEERATNALMTPAAVLPTWLGRLVTDGPRLRDGASLNTSYVELGTGRGGTFLGHPLQRGLIASSILAPPGLATVFAGCAGRLSVAVPGQTGASQDALFGELLEVLAP